MAIIIRTHILCDGCGITYGIDMQHIPGTVHRKEMVNAGWVFTQGKDLCNTCRPKRKDGTNFPTPKIPRRKPKA